MDISLYILIHTTVCPLCVLLYSNIARTLIAIKIDVSFDMCSVKMTETNIKSCNMAITNQLNDPHVRKGSNIVVFSQTACIEGRTINTRN